MLKTQSDSRTDPDKPLAEQFNLLQVVYEDRYPASFEIRERRFQLSIKHSQSVMSEVGL